MKTKYLFASIAITLCGAASGALAQPFMIPWWTVDGGGVTFSFGGDFEMSATLGQPDAGMMSGGDFTLSGGFWVGCRTPTLTAARSAANHSAGEFSIDLDLTANPAARTVEPRGSGLRILDFLFDVPIVSGSISVNGGAVVPMTLLDGGTRGRTTLAGALPNDAVHTIEIAASSGPGCDMDTEICVAALVGDFNNSNAVTAADKGELLGFFGQPITAANARYDVQVGGGLTVNAADIGFWTGFFGATVAGDGCP